MSFLIMNGERYALQIGETTLGGDDDEVLAQSPLAALGPFARVSVSPVGDAVIDQVPGGPSLTIDGNPLDASPVPLRHGMRLAVGGLQIIYGALGASGRTAPRAAAAEQSEASFLDAIPSEQPTASTGGRLTSLADQRVHRVTETGLTIGRSAESAVVLEGAQISRNHARIEPTLLGYVISDSSSTGILVNGQPVEVSQRLSQGDVIRIGTHELRFEADPATFETDPSSPAVHIPVERPVAPAATPQQTPPAQAKSNPDPDRPVLLATLEVLTPGPLLSQRFRVERPVVHLGRGDYNEVALPEESVSTSHAMMMLKDSKWRITDLGSRNGTYVDGQRVTEAVIPGACEIRIGNVRLVFRPLARPSATDKSTRGIVAGDV